MAKSKKDEVKTSPVQSAQEGDIDPYSAGNHIANPEPDNGAANKPADREPTFDTSGQEIPANDTPNSDQAEQDEVAAERQETPSKEAVETPAEEASEPAPEEAPAEKPVATAGPTEADIAQA